MPHKKKKPAKSKTKGKSNIRKHGRRADYGASIDGVIAKQPPPLREIPLALDALIKEAAPDATSALKWGMPFYMLEGQMMCALGSHKAHVNLIMVAPPAALKDKQGRLEGTGKGGRHLKLKSLDELP